MTEPASPRIPMVPIIEARIESYAAASTTPEPPHLVELADATHSRTSDPGMMVGQLEGRLLAMLIHMLRPRGVLEIGTFTGYSALSMAEALPEGGRIVTLDVSEAHVAIAREHIGRSTYSDRIEIRLGPALETLATLDGPFDFVFIDADKANVTNYYEAVLPLLPSGGVIAVDNVLWSGRVLDPSDETEDTRALVAFNAALPTDPRVECVMLTVRDGLTLIRKR